MKFRLLYVLMLLMCSVIANAQLSPFTMTVTAVNETCPFNGSITMTLGNATPGASIQYSLYLLPNTTTPIAQFTQNTRGSLDSGNYRLIATQQLNDLSNTQTQDFSILDETVPLDFSLVQSSTTTCNVTGGILTVNVISGKAPFFYEILAGPITRPFQLSNVFNNLSAGDYTIRVLDACGTAEVQQYTLILDTTILTIGASSNPIVATSCTTIEVINDITPADGTSIIYPITVTYTIHPPPGFGPDQVVQQVYNSGPTDLLPLSVSMSNFGNQPFSYDLLITDNCNQPFSSLNNAVDTGLGVNLVGNPNECGDEYLIIGVSNFTPPYTLVFIDAPATFNPLDFNAQHGSPVTGPLVEYGTDELTVPLGNYEVEVTDSCGRVETASYLVEKIPLIIDPTITLPNCTVPTGRVSITIPDGRKVVTATLISAPPEYTTPLPQNLAQFINGTTGVLVVPNLPPNDSVPYVFSLVDSCSDIYNPVEALIENISVSNEMLTVTRFSCEPGFGSARVRSPNGPLTSVTIVEAPAGFTMPLPFIATAMIVSGSLFLSDLPGGDYKFTGSDGCNTPLTGAATVPFYNPGSNNYVLQRNCGSFHITVTDNSNLIGSYFLQRLDPTTNLWEHPDTGEDYVDTTLPPNSNNGLPMVNLTPLLNRITLGTYRIVKVIPVFENGNSTCMEEYPPFDFFDNLVIKRAYTLDCLGNPTDVLLDVEGVPPYIFRVRADSSQPYTVNVGNIFQNLVDGITYEFQVEDSCGNQRLLPTDLGSLLPLVVANDPIDANGNSEMLICGENNQTTGTFDIKYFESSILGNQPPDNYVVTYHNNFLDARDTGANPLSSPYTTSSNHETIYVRVMHKTIGVCADVTDFDLYVGEKPIITATAGAFLCDGAPVTLVAEAGYQQYNWSTGETTSSITVDTPGTYTVTASNVYGTSICESDPVSISVTASGIPTKLDFETSDWTDNQNSITVIPNGIGSYEYSLDGINYQDSAIFTGLTPGIYKVYVNDKNKCGFFIDEVVLLNYPKFFTPNGDGFNDRWQIQFAPYEPNMNIYIFDRYGKLMAGFGSKSPGWDGTYQGKQMPSTDYWFMVERTDGRILKGHFAMKR